MALTTGFFSSSRLILAGVHRVLTCGCAGSPLIPRAEVSLRRAGQGTGIILKDEWRLNRRSHPAPLPRTSASHLCPRLHIYMYAKSPRLLPPFGVRKPRAFIRYSLLQKQLLCLGCFVAGKHRCGCGQFGAGHECGAEGCELACVAFGYTEQGQQLGGRVGHDGLQ